MKIALGVVAVLLVSWSAWSFHRIADAAERTAANVSRIDDKMAGSREVIGDRAIEVVVKELPALYLENETWKIQGDVNVDLNSSDVLQMSR